MAIKSNYTNIESEITIRYPAVPIYVYLENNCAFLVTKSNLSGTLKAMWKNNQWYVRVKDVVNSGIIQYHWLATTPEYIKQTLKNYVIYLE